jgi:hypothetical protein
MTQFRPQDMMAQQSVLDSLKSYPKAQHIMKQRIIVKEVLTQENRNIVIEIIKSPPEFSVLAWFISKESEANPKCT